LADQLLPAAAGHPEGCIKVLAVGELFGDMLSSRIGHKAAGVTEVPFIADGALAAAPVKLNLERIARLIPAVIVTTAAVIVAASMMMAVVAVMVIAAAVVVLAAILFRLDLAGQGRA
jgi:hypothetical protein